ncbi:hypothetical protein N7463_000877, partial [Penicillium fimorum]
HAKTTNPRTPRRLVVSSSVEDSTLLPSCDLPFTAITIPQNINIWEDHFSIAIETFRQIAKPMAALARELQVPYTTLYSRINGSTNRSRRPANNKALDPICLVSWVTILDVAFTQPTPDLIEQSANLLLSRLGSDRAIGAKSAKESNAVLNVAADS